MNRRSVDLGGYRLAAREAGVGSPTVVLEAGAGCASDVWAHVQEGVAQFTRVVSYDRAGVGESEPAPTPRTGQEVAADLHTLLSTAGVPGPYVLVGHSLGGLLVRVYAHRYPDEVVGMVLLDAPHPEYPQQALALLPPETDGECTEVRESRHFFAEGINDPSTDPEGINMGALCKLAQTGGSLGSRPLVVISAGQHEPFPNDFPPDLAVQIRNLVEKMQRDLANLSSNSTHIIAEKSGHFIQSDQPELVISAIRQVVEAVRSG